MNSGLGEMNIRNAGMKYIDKQYKACIKNNLFKNSFV